MQIIIVGGSLAGLMCGIALKHAGHDVKIVEQDSDERQSHMSGVCLGPSAITFLARHDCSAHTFSHESNYLQVLRKGGPPRVLVRGRRIITSWDTFYYRLRSIFDGYTSPYCPVAPESQKEAGLATYLSHTKVVDVNRVKDDDGGGMELTLANAKSSEPYQERADLIIGADGSGSFIRQLYLPTTQRQFVGYVAWRGTVPESEVSAETRQTFTQGITLHLGKRQHCVVYTIPGERGSLETGERLLNFLWYTNEDEASMNEIMIDAIDGHRHHTTVPMDRVRPEIWAARVEQARHLSLPEPLVELISKIQRPYLQAVSQVRSPQASFEDGKVLLVGDALAQFCPHTGLSSAQGAFHAAKVAEYVSGKISLRQWEQDVLGYSYIYWLQSLYWGKFYQRNVFTAICSGLHYWATYGLDRLKLWWQGRQSSRPNEFKL